MDVVTLAVETKDSAVQLSVEINSSIPNITLMWEADSFSSPSFYQISRISKNAIVWKEITKLPGSATTFVDTDVQIGATYEYEVFKKCTDRIGVGYIYTGINVPAIEYRGNSILVVDNTVAHELSFELERLMNDMTGDGWNVLRINVNRTGTVNEVRSLIQSCYNQNSTKTHAVLLFGHIPVPYSGYIFPDGHYPDHLGAWPADVKYASTGNWTDNGTNPTNPTDSRNLNIPGDGKDDQGTIPTEKTRFELGRVDMNDLPSFVLSETELLRQYLDKNHDYRHKLGYSQSGIIYDGLGYFNGEPLAGNGWRNFTPLFGAQNIHTVSHNEFIPSLAVEKFIFGYACGFGTYTSLAGLGTTEDFARCNTLPVFLMLFGSYFGDWDSKDNLLRAVLATKTGGLASCWAGRPSWYFHHMGLGEPIGYSAFITQNNDGKYRMAGYGRQMVHVALLGDPTLRLHVVAPPEELETRNVSGCTVLSWKHPDDKVIGYNVYRRNKAGQYVRLNDLLITTNEFRDEQARINSISNEYMVRTEKIENTGSGSYHNLSQGVFAKASFPNNIKFRRAYKAH